MNCTVHPENAATAYCRTCGKAMCDACKHTVHGVIYCEDCLASRVNQPGAAVAPVAAVPGGAPSPGLAMALGFIPGVGAMYNGQFIKGLIHVVVFATLIWLADHGGDAFAGLLIAFWVFYMVFDAYKTAKARLYGLPLPDPFGIERAFGSGATGAAPAATTMATPGAGSVPSPSAAVPGQAVPTGYVAAEPACPREPSPIGAIVLIGLGVLFLLNQFGWWQFHWLGRMWPLVLIGLGVWLFIRRFGTGTSHTEQHQ